MKVQQTASYLVLSSLAAAVCALFTFAGCAAMESASQESLLQKAGFQSRTPTTAEQKLPMPNCRPTSSIAAR
jgi:hypothetical protein